MDKNSCIKVLVVDDSITYRNILKAALADFDSVEVIGTAFNGSVALEKIERYRPDLVLLDIEMPEMGGLEALEEIVQRFPQTGVIMISGVNPSSMDNTIKALELGALDFIKKPEGRDVNANVAYIRNYLKPIIRVFSISYTSTMVEDVEVYTGVTKGIFPTGVIPAQYDLLVIGSSTGGPGALMKLLPPLSSSITAPILIVQHMPSGFTASFSRSLDDKSKLKVVEAQEGEILKAGWAYVAPGGKHLLVRKVQSEKYVTALSDAPPENNCKPSIDILFRSLAEAYEGNILAVILTGMGYDGMKGIEAMKKRGGCYCITQSEKSCVVYGMPRAIDEAGLSDSSLALDGIGAKIMELTGGRTNVSVCY